MVSARAAALHALLALEKGRGERLADALEQRAARSVPARERALAFELAHGVVRRERLLDHVLSGLATRGLPKDPALRCALRLGAYQLLYSTGIPPHAAVDETVKLVRTNRGFANAVLRRLAEHVQASAGASAGDPIADPMLLALGSSRVLRLPSPLPEDEVERLATLHSLPAFLVARWLDAFGAEGVGQIGEAATAVPAVFLRVAFGRERDELRAALAAAGVATEPTTSPHVLKWTGGDSPFGAEPFAKGWLVAQDPTAVAAVDAVPCHAGDTVVDLCAAPGTKTTWLAGKVGAEGRVFAYDPDEARRWRIEDNVRRLHLEDRVEIVDRPEQLPRADAVLVDAPCSNSGVLGRRVEVRRRIAPQTFARMAVLQRELLRQAIGLARPGGHVVYSTCSIDHEENEQVVDLVLRESGAARCEVLRAEATLPLAGVRDGGYLAVLRRGADE